MTLRVRVLGAGLRSVHVVWMASPTLDKLNLLNISLLWTSQPDSAPLPWHAIPLSVVCLRSYHPTSRTILIANNATNTRYLLGHTPLHLAMHCPPSRSRPCGCMLCTHLPPQGSLLDTDLQLISDEQTHAPAEPMQKTRTSCVVQYHKCLHF